jgi:hypothetical protein
MPCNTEFGIPMRLVMLSKMFKQYRGGVITNDVSNYINLLIRK